MVEFGGAAHPKFAGSGTLTVIEIHLSPDAPQDVVQELKGFVVGPPPTEGGAKVVQSDDDSHILRIQARGAVISSGVVRPGLVKLIPVDAKTGKPSWIKLAVLLVLAQIAYNVTGTADHVIQFLEHYQDYLQPKIDGLGVPIDQAKQLIRNAQPTSKNEQPEKSANPPATPSEGD